MSDYGEAHIRSSLVWRLQEHAVRLWALDNREGLFKKYAGLCVKEWVARGRDVRPLQAYIKSLEHEKLTPSI